MFKKLTISKKIGFGFGLILMSLLCLVVLCFTGVGSIVDNAAQVIYGNALDAEMGQREIDHLNWVNQVNRLLTDDQVTTLDAQLDHTQCAFGKWLYGDPRKEAQQHVQGLDVIFREIEEPHQHLHESAAQIKALFHQADAQLPGLLADRISDHLKWSVVIRDCLLTNCDSIKVEIDSTKCALGKWLATPQAQLTYKNATKEMREAWDMAVSYHQSLHQSAQKINDDYRQVHEGLEGQMLQMLVDHKDWAQQLNTVLLGGDKQIHLEADPHQCRFGKFLESQACKDWMNAFPAFKKAIEQSKEPHKHLHESATTILALMAQGPEGHAKAVGIYQQVTMPSLDQIGQCFNSAIEAEGQLVKAQRGCLEQFNGVTLPLLGHTISQLDRMKSLATIELEGMKQANAIYSSKTLPNLQQVQKLLADARKKVSENIMTEEAMLVAAKNTKKNVGMLGSIGIIAGIVLAFIIAMSIIKPLRRIIDAMESGSAQVSQASEQVSSSSQSMAEGASEQASSLEQTSASLEQMNATVRQNAENALQANKMAETARQISVKSNEAMKRLTQTIGKIKTSSDQTSGILKTIDEIAFQTNLLALNAAVEAARAGEAGKGFAVVAEEVRSLAQRSAQASKSTAQLIEDACRNADQGVNVAGEAESTLSQIDGAVDHVTQLINLVSAASSEQADGIDQITKAVGQMDQVTQSNAANSEESAAASEELSAQAEELNGMVDELVAMVMGPRKIAQVSARSVVKASASKSAAHRHMQKVHVTHAGHSRKSASKPAQHVIALDDDDQINEF